MFATKFLCVKTVSDKVVRQSRSAIKFTPKFTTATNMYHYFRMFSHCSLVDSVQFQNINWRRLSLGNTVYSSDCYCQNVGL